MAGKTGGPSHTLKKATEVTQKGDNSKSFISTDAYGYGYRICRNPEIDNGRKTVVLIDIASGSLTVKQSSIIMMASKEKPCAKRYL